MNVFVISVPGPTRGTLGQARSSKFSVVLGPKLRHGGTARHVSLTVPTVPCPGGLGPYSAVPARLESGTASEAWYRLVRSSMQEEPELEACAHGEEEGIAAALHGEAAKLNG